MSTEKKGMRRSALLAGRIRAQDARRPHPAPGYRQVNVLAPDASHYRHRAIRHRFDGLIQARGSLIALTARQRRHHNARHHKRGTKVALRGKRLRPARKRPARQKRPVRSRTAKQCARAWYAAAQQAATQIQMRCTQWRAPKWHPTALASAATLGPRKQGKAPSHIGRQIQAATFQAACRRYPEPAYR